MPSATALLDELDFVPPRGRGRAKRDLTVGEVRPLRPSDVALLSAERGVTTPSIARIRDRHHALARALAAGMGEGQAAAFCGWSLSRVSILKNDPSFKELLAFYREQQDPLYADMAASLAGVSRDALEELRTRLEEAPEAISNGTLVEIAKMGADRTGHGPATSSTQVNVNLNLAARLESARKRVAELTPQVIEHLPQERE
jgi:hypothetical protein